MLKKLSLLIFSLVVFTACQISPSEQIFDHTLHVSSMKEETIEQSVNLIDLTKYERNPLHWGKTVPGVHTHFSTEEKEIALTINSTTNEGQIFLDESLLAMLLKEQIPFTFFVTESWLTTYPHWFKQLQQASFVEIENFGTDQLALSVISRKSLERSTQSPKEVYEEIMIQHDQVLALTGREMNYYRSPIGNYDEIAIQLANELNYEVVNYTLVPDADLPVTTEEVYEKISGVSPGTIIALHMNRQTLAEGVQLALVDLKRKGYQFSKLEAVIQ